MGNNKTVIRYNFVKECFDAFSSYCKQKNIDVEIDEKELSDSITYHFISIGRIAHKALKSKENPLVDHHKIIASMEYSIMLHLPIYLESGDTHENCLCLNSCFAFFLGAYILKIFCADPITSFDSVYSNSPLCFIDEHKRYLQNIPEWIVLIHKQNNQEYRDRTYFRPYYPTVFALSQLWYVLEQYLIVVKNANAAG